MGFVIYPYKENHSQQVMKILESLNKDFLKQWRERLDIATGIKL